MSSKGRPGGTLKSGERGWATAWLAGLGTRRAHVRRLRQDLPALRDHLCRWIQAGRQEKAKKAVGAERTAPRAGESSSSAWSQGGVGRSVEFHAGSLSFIGIPVTPR